MQKIFLATIFSTVFHLAQAQLTVEGDSLITLGSSRVQLSKQGFPEQIDSLLAENIHFHFTRQPDGKDIRLTSGGVHFTQQNGNRAEWDAVSTSEELQMEVHASLRSNGRLSYKVTVTALQDLDMKDITMHIPFRPGKEKEIYHLQRGDWDNHGKGGTTVGLKGKSMLVNNYSGSRHLQKGDRSHFNFDLVVTN